MTLKNQNMKICIRILLVAIILLAGVPVAVSAVTVIDDAGTNITLDTPPRHIVSLSPSNTEILAALGLSDRISGITDYCDYPPEIRNKTRVGGYSSLSIEKIAALKPDLVVASDKTPKETINRLREIGLTVIMVAPRNIDSVIRDIRVVGQITGTETQADIVASEISRRIAAASAARGPGNPTVAHVVYIKPLYISGNATMQDDIITRAGGTNVFTGRNGWGTVSLEEFLQADPDIIIVSSGAGMDPSGRDLILDEFMTNPQYSSLTAVRNHHVYAIDADIISRPGPRVADAAEQVGNIICGVESEHAGQQSGASTTRSPQASGFSAIAAVIAMLGLFAATRMMEKSCME